MRVGWPPTSPLCFCLSSVTHLQLWASGACSNPSLSLKPYSLTHKTLYSFSSSERGEVFGICTVESLLFDSRLSLLLSRLLISHLLLLTRSLRTASSSTICISVPGAVESRRALRLQLGEYLSNLLLVELLININADLVSVVVPVKFFALN